MSECVGERVGPLGGPGRHHDRGQCLLLPTRRAPVVGDLDGQGRILQRPRPSLELACESRMDPAALGRQNLLANGLANQGVAEGNQLPARTGFDHQDPAIDGLLEPRLKGLVG